SLAEIFIMFSDNNRYGPNLSLMPGKLEDAHLRGPEPRSGETMLATGASPWNSISSGTDLAGAQPRSGDTTLATGVSPWFSNWHSALAPLGAAQRLCRP